MAMLHDYLLRSAHSCADRPALKIREQVLTYRELADEAKCFSQMLRASGIQPGSRIALWLPKEISIYVAVHGTLAAGCAYVPIDLSAPPKRVAWVLEDSHSEVLICRAADAVLLQDHLPKTLRIMVTLGGTDAAVSSLPENLAVLPWQLLHTYSPSAYSDADLLRDPEQLAYILYTSGSTGTPKGVAISHRAALAFVDWSACLCGLTSTDRVSNHASLSFDLSVFDIFAAAKAGACLCPITVVGMSSGYVFARFIEDEGISVWYSVPSVLSRIAEQQRKQPRDLGSLRVVIFAGEPFHKVELQRLAAVLPGVTLFNWYGPTETNVCTSHQVSDIDLADDGALPVGQPCPYSTIHLAEDGEALVSGESLLSGYIGRGAVDSSALIFLSENGKGPYYRTGDYLSYREDGCLLYHGRRDSQLKRHGYRIEAGEIEEVAKAMPAVQDAAVLIVNDHMVLYVALQGETSKQTILAGLAGRLPAYMMPDEIVELVELPRNDRGKLDRVVLQTAWRNENATTPSALAPA